MIAMKEQKEPSPPETLDEARQVAASELASFARTFSLRAKNDPRLRIAFAELEDELRKRARPEGEAAA